MKQAAIDTCVFEQYLNLSPEWNQDHHIDQMLAALQRRNTVLCVDSNNRISGEYDTKIKPMILSRNETGLERYVLSYWMLHCPRAVVQTDETDHRMNRIKREIHEKEPVDQAFVYVACAQDCKLVTNDDGHILSRRGPLRKATKGFRGDNTDFISSRQAAALVTQPEATD